MKRIDLGVILPGNPDCVQEQGVVLKILTQVIRFGPPVGVWGFLIVGAIAFFAGKLNEWMPLVTILIMMSIALMIPHFIWKGKRCPYCHHFFTMERISEDRLVDSQTKTVSRTVNEYHSGMAYDLKGNFALLDGKTSYRQEGKETTRTYVYNERCCVCGCVNKEKTSRSTTSY